MHLNNKIFPGKMSYCIVHHGGTQTWNTLEFYKTIIACNTFWSDFHRYTVPNKIHKIFRPLLGTSLPKGLGICLKSPAFMLWKRDVSKRKSIFYNYYSMYWIKLMPFNTANMQVSLMISFFNPDPWILPPPNAVCYSFNAKNKRTPSNCWTGRFLQLIDYLSR